MFIIFLREQGTDEKNFGTRMITAAFMVPFIVGLASCGQIDPVSLLSRFEGPKAERAEKIFRQTAEA